MTLTSPLGRQQGSYNYISLSCTIAAPTGSIYHTASPQLWHADLSFVNTATEPVSDFDCEAAFELVPGSASELKNATCTPRAELFFDLYQQGDPLQVGIDGGGWPGGRERDLRQNGLDPFCVGLREGLFCTSTFDSLPLAWWEGCQGWSSRFGTVALLQNQ